MKSKTLRDGILEHLKSGRENAITGRELANRLGERDTRNIRDEIAKLVHDGIPIASTMEGEPKGYFIIKNHEEAKRYMASETSRINHMAQRLRDFQSAAKLGDVKCGQLSFM